MRALLHVLGLLVVLASGGCEGRPTNFYYLEPLRSTEAVAADSALRLAVDKVDLPAYLDRSKIVTQMRANRLEVSEIEQWAEPLDEGFARVLRANLAGLLVERQVSVVPADFTDADAKIFVHVSRFEVMDSGDAVLEAFWRIVRVGDGHELVFRHSKHRQQLAGEGYAAITAALNEALNALSRDIATAAMEQRDQLSRQKSRSRG